MPTILLFRFSAMGDVLLTVPVVRSLVQTYPTVYVTVVTRLKFAPFFEGIERVTVVAADIDTEYKGVIGLWRLFKTLTKGVKYEVVIDLHDVIRTQVLRLFFRLAGTPIIVFDKGRAAKKKLIIRPPKTLIPLPHTTTRYADACAQAGYPITLCAPPVLSVAASAHTALHTWLATLPTHTRDALAKKNTQILGIAPFAKHATKQWGFDKIRALTQILCFQNTEIVIFLFGGGNEETVLLQQLAAQYPQNCFVVAGQLPLQAEVALMQKLDALLCMDSSNLHLAALAGTKTVSIWGATHHFVGFAPYGNAHTIIQISEQELPCRPCSVFGDKPCYRGDHACMARIGATAVAAALGDVSSF